MISLKNEAPIESSKSIVLVEDNPGDVYIVRSSLSDSKLPHSFYHVEDGEEIMFYLHQEKGYQNKPLPDLILLDLNLPKKSGFEVLAEIKTDNKLRIIPVIILTSSSAEQDIIKSYQLQANSYIIKPTNYFDFFQLIKELKFFWLDSIKISN